MSTSNFLDAAIKKLRQDGKLKNSDLLIICEHDHRSLLAVREQLVDDGIARDVNGIGLDWLGDERLAAESTTPDCVVPQDTAPQDTDQRAAPAAMPASINSTSTVDTSLKTTAPPFKRTGNRTTPRSPAPSAHRASQSGLPTVETSHPVSATASAKARNQPAPERPTISDATAATQVTDFVSNMLAQRTLRSDESTTQQNGPADGLITFRIAKPTITRQQRRLLLAVGCCVLAGFGIRELLRVNPVPYARRVYAATYDEYREITSRDMTSELRARRIKVLQSRRIPEIDRAISFLEEEWQETYELEPDALVRAGRSLKLLLAGDRASEKDFQRFTSPDGWQATRVNATGPAGGENDGPVVTDIVELFEPESTDDSAIRQRTTRQREMARQAERFVNGR